MGYFDRALSCLAFSVKVSIVTVSLGINQYWSEFKNELEQSETEELS